MKIVTHIIAYYIAIRNRRKARLTDTDLGRVIIGSFVNALFLWPRLLAI